MAAHPSKSNARGELLDKKAQLKYLQRAVRERKYLLKNPDVLGVGVGYRERDGAMTDELAFIVYVTPGRKQTPKDLHPRHRRIPEHVIFRVRGKQIRLPVDIVESDVGQIHRDVISGASVGNRLLDQVTGTVGWIARNRKGGNPVLCSNYHVLLPLPPAHSNVETLAFSGGAATEFAVLPSIKDGGDPNLDVIGEVIRGRRDVVTDAAITAIDTTQWTPRPEVDGVGTYGAARKITSDDLASEVRVTLRGRTSGTLSGKIVAYPNAHAFGYPDLDTPLFMSDLIATDIQTQEGDSGSLLLDEKLRPLGILLGMGGGRSNFIHIANIMSSMQIKDF